MPFAVEFKCVDEASILYITLKYPLNDTSFPVYQWVHWKDSAWQDISSSYDQVSHAWVATSNGYLQYFGIVQTTETTETKSVEVGGGIISSFEYFPAFLGVGLIILMSKKRKKGER